MHHTTHQWTRVMKCNWLGYYVCPIAVFYLYFSVCSKLSLYISHQGCISHVEECEGHEMLCPELPYCPEIPSLTLPSIMLNVFEAAHSPAAHVTSRWMLGGVEHWEGYLQRIKCRCVVFVCVLCCVCVYCVVCVCAWVCMCMCVPLVCMCGGVLVYVHV